MGVPIRRASSVSESDFNPLDSIERVLRAPITQESIERAEAIFNRAVKDQSLSRYGELGCSFETYSRSMEPYDQAKEMISSAKKVFEALQK